MLAVSHTSWHTPISYKTFTVENLAAAAICSRIEPREMSASPGGRGGLQVLRPLCLPTDAACISGPVKAAANGTPPHQRGLIKSSIYLRQALDKQNPPQFPFCAGVQPSEVHWRTYWHSIKGGPLSKAGRCKSCAPLPSNFPLTQLLDCNNVTECSNQFWFTSGQHVAFSSAHCY